MIKVDLRLFTVIEDLWKLSDKRLKLDATLGHALLLSVRRMEGGSATGVLITDIYPGPIGVEISGYLSGHKVEQPFVFIFGTKHAIALRVVGEVIMFRWLSAEFWGAAPIKVIAVDAVGSLVDKSALADFVRLLREADDDDAKSEVADVE